MVRRVFRNYAWMSLNAWAVLTTWIWKVESFNYFQSILGFAVFFGVIYLVIKNLTSFEKNGDPRCRKMRWKINCRKFWQKCCNDCGLFHSKVWKTLDTYSELFCQWSLMHPVYRYLTIFKADSKIEKFWEYFSGFSVGQKDSVIWKSLNIVVEFFFMEAEHSARFVKTLQRFLWISINIRIFSEMLEAKFSQRSSSMNKYVYSL